MRADNEKLQTLLTPLERKVMDCTVATWNASINLDLDKDDRDDLRRAIHEIQRIVLSQSFALDTSRPGGVTFDTAPPFTSRPQR